MSTEEYKDGMICFSSEFVTLTIISVWFFFKISLMFGLNYANKYDTSNMNVNHRSIERDEEDEEKALHTQAEEATQEAEIQEEATQEEATQEEILVEQRSPLRPEDSYWTSVGLYQLNFKNKYYVPLYERNYKSGLKAWRYRLSEDEGWVYPTKSHVRYKSNIVV